MLLYQCHFSVNILYSSSCQFLFLSVLVPEILIIFVESSHCITISGQQMDKRANGKILMAIYYILIHFEHSGIFV